MPGTDVIVYLLVWVVSRLYEVGRVAGKRFCG